MALYERDIRIIRLYNIQISKSKIDWITFAINFLQEEKSKELCLQVVIVIRQPLYMSDYDEMSDTFINNFCHFIKRKQSFCIIIFVPLLLATGVLFSFQQIQMKMIEQTYGIEDEDYGYLSNSVQLLNRLTKDIYTELQETSQKTIHIKD